MAATLSRLFKVVFPPYPEPSAVAEGAAGPLRIGVLGAADIAPRAVVHPAKLMPDKVQIYSVAARNPEKAKAFAKQFGIPHTHDSYDELLADPQIQAVYIPLPNGLHYEWAVKCIERGLPVLLEKPAAANADQTAKLFAIAKEKNVLVVEAFHWWFYPDAQKAKAIISNKEEFGELLSYEGSLAAHGLPKKENVRYDFALAGGSIMDMGCYPICWMRYFMGEEPVSAKGLGATCFPGNPKIDAVASVEYAFASNPEKKGIVHCGMKTPYSTLFKIGFLPYFKIKGTKKTLLFTNPLFPNLFHSVEVTDNATGVTTMETVYEPGKEHWSTYTYQMEAFANLVTGATDTPYFSNENSVANMKAVDMAYEAIGYPIRE
ncbi:uncharacterized protein V1518DRAFT_418773 [Limtongia smithiae]|uniref:uncharacterized protein n=1 Tax=Limtongia smithiae TaxID=1125753 RepID=UPI0034CDE0C7